MRWPGAALALAGLSSAAIHVLSANSMPSFLKVGLALFVGFLLFNLLITDRYQSRWMTLLMSLSVPLIPLLLVVLTVFTSFDTTIMTFFLLSIFAGVLKISFRLRSALSSQKTIRIITRDKSIAFLAKQSSCSLPRELEMNDRALWDDKAFKAS